MAAITPEATEALNGSRFSMPNEVVFVEMICFGVKLLGKKFAAGPCSRKQWHRTSDHTKRSSPDPALQ